MWIAAVINPHGTPAAVVDAVDAGQVVAVITEALLDELAEVLARPKFRRWVSADDAAAFVAGVAGRAKLHPDPDHVPRVVRDPDDDYLVAVARAARATVVTGDADLLAAATHPPSAPPLSSTG